MTREEEIQNYAYNNCIAEDVDDTSYSLIVDAIKWADETMIDRACEWLNDTDFDMEYWNQEDGFCKEEFITAFRQAMEGGAE